MLRADVVRLGLHAMRRELPIDQHDLLDAVGRQQL
jgi:hypothetical protein